jgi:dCTP deaminase
MSTLSRPEIERRLMLPLGHSKRLVITPMLSSTQLGDVSFDLRLGNQFIIFRMHALGQLDPFAMSETDLHRAQERRVVRFGQKFVLHPGQLALACTFEYMSLPADLEGQVEGRSSWARVGLQIATATCVEPRFSGVVTLELSNVGTIPLELHPGARVAQLVLRQVSPPATSAYGGRRKYRHSIGPQFCRLNTDAEARIFTADEDP